MPYNRGRSVSCKTSEELYPLMGFKVWHAAHSCQNTQAQVERTNGAGNGFTEGYSCMTLWCWAYVAMLSARRGTSGPPSFVTRYRRKDLILFACTLPAPSRCVRSIWMVLNAFHPHSAPQDWPEGQRCYRFVQHYCTTPFFPSECSTSGASQDTRYRLK